MSMFLIIIAVVAVVAIFVISVYNGLVKSRMQTQEAWSQIDVQLKRRNDLIPRNQPWKMLLDCVTK